MQRGKITTKVVIGAVLMAMSIILTRFGSVMLTPQLRVGFGGIPLIISGILLGPLFGFLTGVGADLIGVMINLMGSSFHLGFTLSAGLSGLIPGLVFNFLSKNEGYSAIRNNGKLENIALSIALIVRALLVEAGLNTLWIVQISGKAFTNLLPLRIGKSLIEAVIYFLIIKVILRAISKSELTKI